MAFKPSLRLQFLTAELNHLPNERCSVHVKLGRRLTAALNQTYIGKVDADWSAAAELKCAAEATLEAVKRAFKAKEDTFEVVGIKCVEGFGGEPIVLVKIVALYEGETFELLGLGEVKDHPVKAAALAALFATNRFVTYAFRGK